MLMRVVHSLLLCAIPALALAWFGPAAWSAARSLPAPLHSSMVGTAATGLDQEAAAGLVEWHATETPATILVAQVRRESAAHNGAVRRLRALLQTQEPGTLAYGLTLQSLLLAAAQRDAWESNWRSMGRRGADLRLLSQSLVSLRIEFLAAKASLRSLQAAERAAGTVFSFTPPVF
jgi:hypothetical protein